MNKSDKGEHELTARRQERERHESKTRENRREYNSQHDVKFRKAHVTEGQAS